MEQKQVYVIITQPHSGGCTSDSQEIPCDLMANAITHLLADKLKKKNVIVMQVPEQYTKSRFQVDLNRYQSRNDPYRQVVRELMNKAKAEVPRDLWSNIWVIDVHSFLNAEHAVEADVVLTDQLTTDYSINSRSEYSNNSAYLRTLYNALINRKFRTALFYGQVDPSSEQRRNMNDIIQEAKEFGLKAFLINIRERQRISPEMRQQKQILDSKMNHRIRLSNEELELATKITQTRTELQNYLESLVQEIAEVVFPSSSSKKFSEIFI